MSDLTNFYGHVNHLTKSGMEKILTGIHLPFALPSKARNLTNIRTWMNGAAVPWKEVRQRFNLEEGVDYNIRPVVTLLSGGDPMISFSRWLIQGTDFVIQRHSKGGGNVRSHWERPQSLWMVYDLKTEKVLWGEAAIDSAALRSVFAQKLGRMPLAKNPKAIAREFLKRLERGLV